MLTLSNGPLKDMCFALAWLLTMPAPLFVPKSGGTIPNVYLLIDSVCPEVFQLRPELP